MEKINTYCYNELEDDLKESRIVGLVVKTEYGNIPIPLNSEIIGILGHLSGKFNMLKIKSFKLREILDEMTPIKSKVSNYEKQKTKTKKRS